MEYDAGEKNVSDSSHTNNYDRDRHYPE